MSELGDLYRDWKKEKQAKKSLNSISSEDILIQRKVPFKKFTADHFRVGDFDFWPATGLFINIKTKKRGRGVFNLIKEIK